MRINRFLARSGAADSRRKADDLIRAGRVRLNGVRLTEPGARLEPGRDRVEVDGRVVTLPTTTALYRHYKPRGVVASLDDPKGRPDLGPVQERLPNGCVPVGRLDRDSEGLVLWTNVGHWVERLTHPRYGAPKRYRVVVSGKVPQDFAERLSDVERLDDGTELAYPMELVDAWTRPDRRTVLELRLREGKRRQIRRVLGDFGLEVRRLIRVAEGGVELGELRPGELSPVEGPELEAFVAELGGSDQSSSSSGETPSGGENVSTST